MNSLSYNSDLPLRPDISLLLPTLSILTNNPLLLIVSTAFQPFKWQSACNCFEKLCHRKRLSARIAPFIVTLAVTLYVFAVEETIIYAIGAILALVTWESIDMKVMKCFCMAVCYAFSALSAASLCVISILIYSYVMGWSVRSDSSEILASNQYWLITRDLLLAKRINEKGEYHLEYNVDGNVLLVGDGRLIKKGKDIKKGLIKDSFVDRKDGNVWEEVITRGMAVEHEGVVDLK